MKQTLDPHSPDERTQFGIRQAEMTARWFEAVRTRYGDVDKYIQGRQAAYLDRWREALRFIPRGARVLDVGGGNLFKDLLLLLSQHGVDYWYQDVDPSAVTASRDLAVALGYSPDRFHLGFNDQFSFSDRRFDAIFSSHCIEHSINLEATLRELNRMLVPGGVLAIAVPLGWEENPEHPYFLDADDWVVLMQDFGFDVRVAQVGREYPESGVDLFIACRKTGEPQATRRIQPTSFLKSSYVFASFDDARILHAGESYVTTSPRALKMTGEAWKIEIAVGPWNEMLPILARHDWSGIVRISSGKASCDVDLFRWYPTLQPFRLSAHNGFHGGESVTLTAIGQSPASRAREALLCGVLFR